MIRLKIFGTKTMNDTKIATERVIQNLLLGVKAQNASLEDMQRQYAILLMTFNFERIYRKILGSHISFLLWLYKKNIAVDYFDIADFCKQQFIKRRIPEDVALKPWILFLQGHQLVKFECGIYSITDKGVAFLQYLQDNEYDLKGNQL